MRPRLALVVLLLAAPAALAKEAGVIRALDDGGEANYRFEPARLIVPPGAEVLVTGGAVEPHTLTHDAPRDARRFDTGNIETGTSARFTAPSDVGEHRFFCLYHPGMTGTLVVDASLTPPTEDAPTPTSDPIVDPERVPAAAWVPLAGLIVAAFVWRRA